MPTISWNEIRHRAVAFSKQWLGATSERADKQTFWNEFFEVFGVRRRVVASFEQPVRAISGTYGYIDMFWPGVLLVEHKSRGGNLGRAESQAFRYIHDLQRDGRGSEVPRYVIVSDFARVALHDLENDDAPRPLEIALADLHRHIHSFAFLAGYRQHTLEEQDPINFQAAGIMASLHDSLKATGYAGHRLERFLVRILFCLFAESTGLFEPQAFRLYILNRTAEDGADLGPRLARLFDVLNTPQDQRQVTLDDDLAAFPWVNGALFEEDLGFADFNRDTRNALIACARFDWSRISPAIFGSLFQDVMESQPGGRRQLGGHYTSERDILRVVRSLFLDRLREEFQRATGNKAQLSRFHEKIAGLRFLDPACGCGNFLVVTYRELRLLEIEVLKCLFPGEQQELDIQRLSKIDVDAFFGIEISEWPARIAEVAMWLVDHQMNVRLSEAFGQYFVRLPLRKKPSVTCGNALRLDWAGILPPDRCSYILSNPPFVGAKFQDAQQRTDLRMVAGAAPNFGLLDYVVGWYLKAASYIRGTEVLVGFVSTNSITQGEQAGVLWPTLFGTYGIKIHFAHRTFPWESEARGRAHVHVVIIGFASFDTQNKLIFDYETAAVSVLHVANISPYLAEGPDIAVRNRSSPISPAPRIKFGNQPIDGGNLVLTAGERDALLEREPGAEKFVRRFLGADEFLNGPDRYCLWLRGASPREIRKLPQVMERVRAVREFRLSSKREATQKLAETPTAFAFVSHEERPYLLIPSVSSERRRYIPMAFMSAEVIASNLCLIIPGADVFHFGVLSSAMHMAWVRQICGRLKSDLRYSNKLVYNNFPWPGGLSVRQRQATETAARLVLDARRNFRPATLADLYDPLAMPPELAYAHAALDRAVDLCYRPQPFANDLNRFEHLFALHQSLSVPLLPGRPRTRMRRAASKR